MVHVRNKLSISALKAATKPGSYQDGGGLMLVVKPSGARSWILRTQVDGKRRDFGLGSFVDVTLAQARDRADEIRRKFRSGVDPVAERRAAKLAMLTIPTFKDAAEAAHKERQGSWRNSKHRDDWLSSLRLYVFASLGSVKVDQITAPMVRDVLLPIWLEKPETARRVRQRISVVTGWAASKGYCQPLDMAVMSKGLPKQPRRDGHFQAMAWEAVPTFMDELREAAETNGRLALSFTVLTAARSGETRGATWKEFDLEAKEWTIPASRMKAGREHVVPLSAPALAILDRAKALGTVRPDDPVFPGRNGKPVSDMTLTKILRDMGISDTVHGFRSAFKDWASECSSFPDAVSEAALAHVDKDKTRAAYKRTDFRKARVDLMAAWAQFIWKSGASEKVVPLRKVSEGKAR